MMKTTKPRFKVDWFAPFVPAMLIACGFMRLNAVPKSDAEFVANFFLGVLMLYAAFFNVYCFVHRTWQENRPSEGDNDQRPMTNE
jgi:hypothetical protein